MTRPETIEDWLSRDRRILRSEQDHRLYCRLRPNASIVYFFQKQVGAAEPGNNDLGNQAGSTHIVREWEIDPLIESDALPKNHHFIISGIDIVGIPDESSMSVVVKLIIDNRIIHETPLDVLRRMNPFEIKHLLRPLQRVVLEANLQYGEWPKELDRSRAKILTGELIGKLYKFRSVGVNECEVI